MGSVFFLRKVAILQLINVLFQFFSAGNIEFLVDILNDVFKPADRNVLLLGDLGIGHLMDKLCGDVVFTQREQHGDIVLGKLIVESNPISYRSLPLSQD